MRGARQSPPAVALIAAAAIALALLPAPGCYKPRAVDCVLVCDEQSGCPGGMSCSAGLCTAGPACVLAVAAGETHACATVAGGVKCWGGNAAGQLGAGDRVDRGGSPGDLGPALPMVSLGAGRSVPAVAFGGGGAPLAAGSFHSCALLDGGQVACWGDNRAGQLGAGDLRPRVTAAELGDALPAVALGTGARALSLAAGVYHTCALLAPGDVKCWGDNRFGQLGLGARGNRGGAAVDLGDALPAVDVGAPGGVAAVAAGGYHTCALLSSGEVACWGWNDYGQLGSGDTRPRGLRSADMGAGLARVALGEGRRAAQLAAGAFHTCALLDGGDVKCWGANGAGQLGAGDRDARGTTHATLGDALPAVELGAGRRARAVSAGGAHTCALLDDFSVRCWGLGADGRLGLGAVTSNRGDEAGELGARLPAVRLLDAGLPVSSLTTGADHTCVVQGASISCWGLGGGGRLGTGDEDSRGDGARALVRIELGAGLP